MDLYGHAVNRLSRDLSAAKLNSRGFSAFRDYVARYAASEHFTSRVEETKRLEAELSALRYNVFTRGLRVEVRRHAAEADYSADVEMTFERFQQGSVKEYTFKFGDALEMNHIEAQILAGVAHLHRDTFGKLGDYCRTNTDCFDDVIARFDREIQFYISY